MATQKLQPFTVYLDGRTADAVREAARRRRLSVSSFLSALTSQKLIGTENLDELMWSRILYLSVGMDAALDELQLLRQPPPLQYRSANEPSLRKVVKQVHQARLAEQSDAD